MRRLIVAAAVAAGLALAGGAGVYTLRASDASGCPARDKLVSPTTTFVQAPHDYITVTFHNPNACYGFRDEPFEIDLFGANRRHLISYLGEGPAHGDVGVCCDVTLPPHGTWSVRLGAPKGDSQGLDRVVVCGIHAEARRHVGPKVWQRMPDGGAVTGHGSFPPKSVFDPAKFPDLPDDPTWRTPCDAPPEP